MNLYRDTPGLQHDERLEVPGDLIAGEGQKVRLVQLVSYAYDDAPGYVLAGFNNEPARCLFPEVIGCYIAEEPRK